MAAAPTFQDLYDLGKTEAILRRPDLAVKDGDISDMLLSGAAAMGDRVVGYAAERFNATYVDGARGADLTTLADDHWGIQRLAATKATGFVRFLRLGTTGSAISFPIGTVVATTRDEQGNETRFVTTQAASWPGFTNGFRTVTAEAEVAGPAGNVPGGVISRIVTPATPADASILTVDNTSFQFAGGTDEETDEDLRARVRAYPATLRRGTLDALEFGAKTVGGVGRASAVEDTTGLVTVYVTDLAGNSTGGIVTSSATVTDDGTMTHDVAIELQNWRAAGSLVTVTGGILQTVPITVTLTVRAGTDITTLTAAIQAAITSAVNKLKIGETLYKSLIASAARSVDPDNVVECDVTAPATNTAPTTPGYIIRAGVITVS